MPSKKSTFLTLFYISKVGCNSISKFCAVQNNFIKDSKLKIVRLLFSHINGKAQSNAEIDIMICNYLHMRQQIKTR